jgi:hypothetical protein
LHPPHCFIVIRDLIVSGGRQEQRLCHSDLSYVKCNNFKILYAKPSLWWGKPNDKIVGNVIIEVILIGCESGRDWQFRIVEGLEHKARSQETGNFA